MVKSTNYKTPHYALFLISYFILFGFKYSPWHSVLQTHSVSVRFEVLMGVAMKAAFFRDVMPYSLPTVLKKLLPQKLQAAGSSEILISVCQTAWRHISEDCNLHPQSMFFP